MGNANSGGGPGGGPGKGKDEQKKKKKFEHRAPTRVGKKRRKRGPAAASKVPQV